jgi:hypothetical protein
MGTIGDFMKGDEAVIREEEILKNEIGIFKNLIQERKHPLDLVRELLSNSGAKEVSASSIEISYTSAKEGHIFEICDDGCGMNYTGNSKIPGRLDKFLGLGMSAIAGEKSDEFSWKGLGSKLAYQSKRVEIETRYAGNPFYTVRINDPWGSLERNSLPKPQVGRYAESEEKPGTRLKIFGHPPHRLEEPFSFSEIKTFLLHRTFAGFTHKRENPPKILLSVLGRTEEIEFGFPEFKDIDWNNGIFLEKDKKRLLVNIMADAPKVGPVCLKGFLVWDADKYNLNRGNLNTGLILSAKGIPYFTVDIEDYGSRGIPHANPGIEKTCLVLECDGVATKMNISRSDLVDSPEALEVKRASKRLFEKLETSPEYLEFRQIPKGIKQIASAGFLAEQKQKIESAEQNWVVLERQGKPPEILMREPVNEAEVNALIWKLEVLNALPFANFQTLAYVGAKRGPDLLANFQEDNESEMMRCAAIEVELNFYNYKAHGHLPSQYPKIICWDIPTSGRKARLTKIPTKRYKWTINMGEYQVHVFVIKMMDGINILSRSELKEKGIEL